jgi:hypothetical protein
MLHGMTDTGSALRQKSRGKWLVIGIMGGVMFVLVIATLVILFTRARWDVRSVSVVWSEAHETLSLTNGEFTHAGFSLYYALQNNTGHDITIPVNAKIMKRLTNGGVLADYMISAKPSAATFLPAHQRAQLSLSMQWGCDERDLDGKILRKEDPEVCYVRALADSDGLALFDYDNHLEIELPKPILTKPKR